ncbi:lysozyme [Ptiloglossa arizonensis]|uniref:lysozyme n=1 Tax=Ptiloglossa arizonensis TaxID=3350558 RepID=UPI003F9F10C4
MALLLNISIVICLFSVILIYGQVPGSGGVTISKTCFGCICEAASGCNVSVGCDGSVCGPFRITWGYWADAGKPKLNLDSDQDKDTYSQCVNDPYCAALTVQGYMDKFAQDCNGDGNINCDDFLRIHRLGGYGCNGPLNSKYENTYKFCMKTYEKI